MQKRFLEEHNIVVEDSLWANCVQRWVWMHIGEAHGILTVYHQGPVRCTAVVGEEPKRFLICFEDGSEAEWTAKFDEGLPYNHQFGFTVSRDGNLIFAQSWERGLYAFDTRTGQLQWRTKSRRGITNIYANEKTLLVHQRERALQLLDLQTGEVLQEKRPATAWGFSVLKEGYILCHSRANKWEIIRAEDLETVETIPAKKLPNCCLRDFWLSEDEGALQYYGFENVWDNSVSPPRRLPNLEYRGEIEIGCFSRKDN